MDNKELKEMLETKTPQECIEFFKVLDQKELEKLLSNFIALGDNHMENFLLLTKSQEVSEYVIQKVTGLSKKEMDEQVKLLDKVVEENARKNDTTRV